MNKNTHKNPNNTVKTTYHLNGTVKSKTPYVSGKRHGMATWRKDNAQKRSEIMWKDEKRHGMATWWDEDGIKQYEVTYVDDKQHGVYTEWYENGMKRWEKYFVCDEEYARIEWDVTGNVLRSDLPPQPLPSISPSTTNPITKLKNHIRGWVR